MLCFKLFLSLDLGIFITYFFFIWFSPKIPKNIIFCFFICPFGALVSWVFPPVSQWLLGFSPTLPVTMKMTHSVVYEFINSCDNCDIDRYRIKRNTKTGLFSYFFLIQLFYEKFLFMVYIRFQMTDQNCSVIFILFQPLSEMSCVSFKHFPPVSFQVTFSQTRTNTAPCCKIGGSDNRTLSDCGV